MRFLHSLSLRRKKNTRAGITLNFGLPAQGKWRRDSSPRTITRLLVVGLFFIVVTGLVLATIRQSMAFLTDNASYEIQALDIPEPAYMSVEDVTALSGVVKGANLLHLPIKEVRKRLLEHPNIKDATVLRIMPNVLRIEVKEREPLAQISIGKNYLVDAEGYVLTWNDKFGQTDWPLIEGLDLKSKVVDNKIQSEALADVLQILLSMRGSILMKLLDIKKVQVDLPAGYRFLSGDVAIKMRPGLTPEEISDKFKKLAAVWEDLRKKGIAVDSVDLRFNDIVVTPKTAASKSAEHAAGRDKKAAEKPAKKKG